MSEAAAARTAVTPIKSNIPSLNMTENELIEVLSNSIYPGAQLPSIKLVIGYCKAQQLDPLQKPVHIVPMDVKLPEKNPDGSDKYGKRDTIMPGIGLYRTQASRTGEYVGKSAPEFGPRREIKFGDSGAVEYPEWCRITVKRLVAGVEREFTAQEFWLENYAIAKRGTNAPNTMWKKRAAGQLAKCAEAQALRMAFPEAVGSAPTAEEMEGKQIDYDDDPHPPLIGEPQRAETKGPNGETPPPITDTKPPAAETKPANPEAPATPAANTEKASPRTQQHTESGGAGGADPINESQLNVLRARMKASGMVTEEVQNAAFLAEFKVPLAAGVKVSINRALTWAREVASKKK